MSWKKRGQKGYTGKKTAKEITKGRERQYGEQEIRQQLQEELEGDDYRYYGGKKKTNRIAKHEYWRDRYKKRALEQELKEERGQGCSYLSSYKYKKWAEEEQEKINELKEQKL